ASRREKAVAVLSHMLRPCLLNIVTSAAGFAALALSPLPAVRDLGIFTAAGLLGCLVLTVIGAACALAAPRCEPRAGGRRWLRQCAERLCEAGIRRPALTLAICAAVTLAAAAVGSRVVVDTFTLEFLSPEHPVRRDSALIEARLAPYVPLDFLVRGADGAVTPALVEAIGHWQRAGERLPGVGWSRSPADSLGHAESLDPRVAPDGTLRVTFSIRMQSARGVERSMRALTESARLPQGTTVQAAGYLPLYVRMIDYIVESQISGFALAFLAVFGVIALAFRSARIAALAAPSNLLPLVFILGAMGAAGIRLDAATVTIAAVVLGLVVDDTVHFLHRLNEALEHCADRASALRETVRSAGHAILTTALVMSVGFSVFALSEIRSLVYFGLLIALAMATSVVTDLLLIPALVMLRRSRKPRHAYRSA
ncbi:MAG: efflux RND transporter permease subunit, partial [Burkholderiales bacterium]